MARFVIMGVSGCGKSSVGEALAAAGVLRYFDGDDLHPPANVAKMARGTPLDDADRRPWLTLVGRALAVADPPVALGCSALKRVYRDQIRAQAAQTVHFIHLDAARDVLQGRVAGRDGHFMPASLLDSQIATLEPLAPDETGVRIDIAAPLEEVCALAAKYVRAQPAGAAL